MKWIKKIFGKKEEHGKETVSREIDFKALPSWLDENSQKISSGIQKEASGLLKELEAALSELKTSNSRLAEAKVEGDFDIRAVKRAKSNRENVTKQVSMLTEKIKIQENKDFRALKEFYEMAAQSFENCLEHMNRSFRYTRVVFPQESKEVSDSLASLGQIFNKLGELVLENKKETEAVESAYSGCREIQQISASIKVEESELESKKKKHEATQSEISRTNQELEEFRKSDTWKNLQNTQQELHAIGERLKKAEASLSSLVLPLSNYLSRIKKLHESGKYTLKPEIKQQLELSFSNPEQLETSFFLELQKILEDNSLDMQSQKKEKALSQVKNAISGFEERKKEYLKVFQEFEAKKAEISQFNTGKLTGLEHKGAELSSRTRTFQEDIENSEKKLAALKEEYEDARKKLVSDLNKIDSNIMLNFES